MSPRLRRWLSRLTESCDPNAGEHDRREGGEEPRMRRAACVVVEQDLIGRTSKAKDVVDGQTGLSLGCQVEYRQLNYDCCHAEGMGGPVRHSEWKSTMLTG